MTNDSKAFSPISKVKLNPIETINTYNRIRFSYSSNQSRRSSLSPHLPAACFRISRNYLWKGNSMKCSTGKLYTTYLQTDSPWCWCGFQNGPDKGERRPQFFLACRWPVDFASNTTWYNNSFRPERNSRSKLTFTIWVHRKIVRAVKHVSTANKTKNCIIDLRQSSAKYADTLLALLLLSFLSSTLDSSLWILQKLNGMIQTSERRNHNNYTWKWVEI